VKTAFVLSGGGNLGAVQAGMLQALFRAGITPDLIASVEYRTHLAQTLVRRALTASTR